MTRRAAGTAAVLLFLAIAGSRVSAQLQQSGGSGGSTVTANQGTAGATAWPFKLQFSGTDVALPTALGPNGGFKVECLSGCGSPAATSDNTAFTFGTTSVSPVAFVVDDVSTNSVTENNFGAPRMSGSRVLYVDLKQTQANATAIKVDGSAVTQPVSGTFWQATQPVSGPLTDTQLRASNVNVAVNAALPTGSNTIGAISNTAFTANAGTNLNTSALALSATQTDRTQKTQLTDGTRDGTVKAGSTLPAASDTALVVTTRDTVTEQWTNPAVSSATLTTTTCPGTGCLAVSSLTQASMATVGVTGTFTGAAVVTFDISEDGTNWVGTTCAQASTANYISSFSPTTGGYDIIACPLYGQISDFRVRMTLAPGTGSVVVRATVSSDPVPSPANTVKQGTGGPAWSVKVTDNSSNGPANVKSASTAAVAADPSLVVALSPNSPIPTGSNVIGALSANQSVNVAQLAGTTTDTNSGNKSGGTIRVVLATDQPQLTNKLLVTPDSVALPANQSVNVNQIGGSAVSTAATGVQKVGITGNAGAAIDAANNAAAPANEVAIGLEARSSTPTQATNGNLMRVSGDLGGNQFNVLPLSWTCNQQALAASLTQCQAAPSAGYSLYVTSIAVTTTTTTAGTFAIRYGTGTNCATAPIGIWPQPGGSAPSRVTTAPISTALPLVMNLGPVGFKVAAANAICVIGVATNTIDISLSGYTAP